MSALKKSLTDTRVPRYGVALIEALRIRGSDPARLKQLSEAEWRELLGFADRSQTTLLLHRYCRPLLPDCVDTRIRRNYESNVHRYERLKAAVFEVSQALNAVGIDFILLKGLAHTFEFTPDPVLRSQGDIDLWCLPHEVLRARDILATLRYRPIARSRGRHLDPMIRETHWQWSGDYYARDLPIPIDIHYVLWDRQREGISGPNEEEIWSRRRVVHIDGHPLTMLDEPDLLAFAALHLLLHVLHGDLRLQRAWEIARFLDIHASDEAFWSRWTRLYDLEFRLLQIVIFLLVRRWFECRLPTFIRESESGLPENVALWINYCGFSPIEQLFVPNKDELWLNFHLLRSTKAKTWLLIRRLFPLHAAGTGNISSRLGEHYHLRLFSLLETLVGRAAYHACTLPATCVQGIRWWRLLRIFHTR